MKSNMSAMVAACVCAALVLWLSAAGAQALDASVFGARKSGVAVGVGIDPSSVKSLLQDNEWWMLLQEEDAAKAEAAKKAVGDLYGNRVWVSSAGTGRIALANGYADLVVASSPSAVSPEELKRVLAPGGKAVDTGGKTFGQGQPIAGADDWTHWFYQPDNNPVSKESALKWPLQTAWVDLPYFGAQPQTTVVCNGKTYTVSGNCVSWKQKAPDHRLKDTLMARNMANGRILWERKLSAGYYASRSCIVAQPDGVLILDADAVLDLDGETGKERRKIPAGGQPKWMGVEKGRIYLLVGDPDVPAKDGDKYPPAPVNEKGERLWGFGHTLAAIDLAGGKEVWRKKMDGSIDLRTLAVSAGKVYAVIEDGGAICLDGATGNPVWHNQDAALKTALATPAKKFGHSGLQTTRPGAMVAGGVVLINYKGKQEVVALSADDGKLLWSKEAKGAPTHSWFEDGKLFVSDLGELDPKSGAVKNIKLPCATSGCGPTTVTPNGYFGRHGIEFDRTTGKDITDHAFRSACYQDTFAANGALVSPPYLCGCNYSLRGYHSHVTRPADPQPAPADKRLTKGTAAGPSLKEDDSDWPTYRRNTDRSASSTAKTGAKSAVAWTAAPDRPFIPTPAVAVGDLVLFGGGDGRVQALNAADGSVKWTYYCEGELRAAPTVSGGRAFVGDAAGAVTCLDAATGALVWRYQIAPVDERINLYGKLTSRYPVHSGIVVHGGVAYAAAGIFDRDGTIVCAMDAATGAVKWTNTESAHIDAVNRKGVSAGGGMVVVGDKLYLSAGNAVGIAAYSLADGKHSTLSHVSHSVYDPVHRGRELALFQGKWLVHGSQPLWGSQWERIDGKADSMSWVALEDFSAARTPRFEPSGGCLPIAWDDDLVVSSVRGYLGLDAWGTGAAVTWITENMQEGRTAAGALDEAAIKKASNRLMLLIVKANPVPKDKSTLPENPSRRWGDAGLDCFGLALASDAAIVLSGKATSKKGDTSALDSGYVSWSLSFYDRADGKVLGDAKLPTEPVTSGLCVTRKGRVVVPLIDGRIAAIGGE